MLCTGLISYRDSGSSAPSDSPTGLPLTLPGCLPQGAFQEVRGKELLFKIIFRYPPELDQGSATTASNFDLISRQVFRGSSQTVTTNFHGSSRKFPAPFCTLGTVACCGFLL